MALIPVVRSYQSFSRPVSRFIQTPKLTKCTPCISEYSSSPHSLRGRCVVDKRSYGTPNKSEPDSVPLLSFPEQGSNQEQLAIFAMESSRNYWKNELEEERNELSPSQVGLLQAANKELDDIRNLLELEQAQFSDFKTRLDTISSMLGRVLKTHEK